MLSYCKQVCTYIPYLHKNIKRIYVTILVYKVAYRLYSPVKVILKETVIAAYFKRLIIP